MPLQMRVASAYTQCCGHKQHPHNVVDAVKHPHSTRRGALLGYEEHCSIEYEYEYEYEHEHEHEE